MTRQAAEGKDLAETLAELRADGWDILDTIVIVRSALGVDLGTAKDLVLTSDAWIDHAHPHAQYIELAEGTILKES